MSSLGISALAKKIPPIFTSRAFLALLVLKIVASAFFASDNMVGLFIPFIEYSVQHPLANPYQHFLELGMVKAFPYPPVMLLLMGIPFALFGSLAGWGVGAGALLLARLPLLAADLVIFWVLCKLLPGKESQVTLLYWASPVMFYISYVHGQLDVIPIAMLLLSIYFLLAERKRALSFAFLALGLASKSHLFVVVPIYFIYLLKRKSSPQEIASLFALLIALYLALISPYLFSEGFARLVLEASEQLRVLNLAIPFGTRLAFYIVPAAYLYILFKAYSFKKLTRDAFLMTVGLAFTMLVTLITPEQGWYLWSIPFICYFFIKVGKLDPLIYHAFSASYLAYFAIIPASDIFRVFQVSSPSIASIPNPYALLSALGPASDVLVSLLFTGLTATLLYISYLIYKHGIKSSLIFQEKNGIPAIGIAGDSGAGKTTLAHLLAGLFGQGRTTIIYGDDVHKWERGHPNWSKYTHLNPVANFISYNYEQIRNLKMGKVVMRPIYDHGTGKFTSPVKIQPKDIIVSEGLHTFFIPEYSSIYELKVYLDPDPALRLRWKVRRDTQSRRYALKKVMEQVRRREQDAEKFVRKQKDRSDVVVSLYEDRRQLCLKADMRTSFAAEPLVAALSGCAGLRTRHEYLDSDFQRLWVWGQAGSAQLASAASGLGIDLDDYGIGASGFSGGMQGVLQLLVLCCLHQRLKERAGGE